MLLVLLVPHDCPQGPVCVAFCYRTAEGMLVLSVVCKRSMLPAVFWVQVSSSFNLLWPFWAAAFPFPPVQANLGTQRLLVSFLSSTVPQLWPLQAARVIADICVPRGRRWPPSTAAQLVVDSELTVAGAPGLAGAMVH